MVKRKPLFTEKDWLTLCGDLQGRTMLTLLPAQYEPKESATLYYEVFVRENNKK